MASGIPCEFRTPLCPSLLAETGFPGNRELVEKAPVLCYRGTRERNSSIPPFPPGAEPPDLEKCAEILMQHVSLVRIR
jgi:hypothetical protein